MNKKLWLCVLLAGLLTPLSFQHVRAAPDEAVVEKRRQSHVPIPLSVGSAEQAQEFLAQRLRRAQDMSGVQKLLQDPGLRKLAKEIARDPRRFGMEEKRVQELLQRHPDGPGQGGPDLSDPRWRQLLNDVIEKQSGRSDSDVRISPEQQEAWKKLVEGLAKQPELGGGMQRSGVDSGPRQVERPMPGQITPHSTGTPSSPSATSPSPPSAEPPSPPPTPRGQETRAWFARELARWTEHLQQSDSLRDFVRQLRNATPSRINPTSGMSDSAKRLPRWLDSFNWRPNPATVERSRSLLSRLPSPQPRASSIVPHDPWHVPQPGSLDGGPGGVWQVVLWVALLTGFGLVLWRLLAWQKVRRRNATGWRLGPWPVAPAAVASREDLVRAFEYLSLLCLGPVARHWNHLQIAARLGKGARLASPGNSDRPYAAAQLARLYEQARYAPPSEPLAEADLVTARRHLCLLAGVAAA